MKIIMIGPVYPYKGGISHYTGMMCKALRKKHPTYMISYQMQYPKLLFKKEQRDYTNECFKIKNTKYWINTANPFNIIKTALQIRKLKPDLVIIQWWHPYFAPGYFILQKCLGKCKKLMVCHNVFPHHGATGNLLQFRQLFHYEFPLFFTCCHRYGFLLHLEVICLVCHIAFCGFSFVCNTF